MPSIVLGYFNGFDAFFGQCLRHHLAVPLVRTQVFNLVLFCQAFNLQLNKFVIDRIAISRKQVPTFNPLVIWNLVPSDALLHVLQWDECFKQRTPFRNTVLRREQY